MTETVDPGIIDAINQAQSWTMDFQVVKTGAQGKAAQAVAASAAIAIQDSVDALRNANAIAATASGIALTQFLASGDPRYLEALREAQAMVDKAVESLVAVGSAAKTIVAEFPSG